MKLGANDVTDCKIGGTQVDKVYLGINLVWEKVSLLLDQYPGATSAYSLRKLRNGYSGDAIRVRIDTTGQPTYDIGFDSNGELDTVDLLSKASGNSAYVHTWYDQSVAGNDAIQTTASRQPRIVNSGNLITDNGSVCVDYYSINVRLLLNSTIAVKSSFSVSSYSNIRTVNYIYGDFVSKSGLIACGTGLNGLTAYSDPNVLEYGNSKIVDKQELQILTDDGVNNHIGVDNGTILSSARIGDIKMKCVGSRDTKDFSLDGKLTELITYPTDQTLNISDISNNVNDHYYIYNKLLLDSYPNATAAYSLRKLRRAYTGDSIKVRRSSDNATQDIGFVNNELDTPSLLSFVGAGDGFVHTWFDQSGIGINATQATASKQPRIVNSGVVNKLNGKPSIKFLSTFLMDLNLSQYPFTSGGSATEKSIFAVAENDSTVNQNLYNIADSRDIYALTYNRSGNNTYAFVGANYGNIGGNITGQNIISSLAISPSSKTFNNAVEGLSSNLSRSNFNEISIGSRGGSFPMDGNIQEIVMYESNQSSSRTEIETNINDHYNVY